MTDSANVDSLLEKSSVIQTLLKRSEVFTEQSAELLNHMARLLCSATSYTQLYDSANKPHVEFENLFPNGHGICPKVLPDISSTVAAGEPAFQNYVNGFMTKLTAHSSYAYHDTHASGIEGNTGKVDLALTMKGDDPLWSQVITMAELKSDTGLNGAIGQLIHRSTRVFDHQPKRQHIVCFALHRTGIVFVQVRRLCGDDIKHGARCPQITQTAAVTFNVDSLKHLACLVCSTPEQLGFVPNTVPNGFSSKSYKYSKFQLLSNVASMTINRSRVFLCDGLLVTKRSGTLAVHMVAKFGNQRAVKHEILCLLKLKAAKILHVPTLVDSGETNQDEFKHYLTLRPYGIHLNSSVPSHTLFSVFGDIVVAMKNAFDNCDGLLHRDISHANIVCVTTDVYRGLNSTFESSNTHVGILIDWGSAASSNSSNTAAGTHKFCSPYLSPNSVHSLKDDLISVLFVFLHVISDGRLPWKRHVSPSTVSLLKISLLTSSLSMNIFLTEAHAPSTVRDATMDIWNLYQTCTASDSELATKLIETFKSSSQNLSMANLVLTDEPSVSPQ